VWPESRAVNTIKVIVYHFRDAMKSLLFKSTKFIVPFISDLHVKLNYYQDRFYFYNYFKKWSLVDSIQNNLINDHKICQNKITKCAYF